MIKTTKKDNKKYLGTFYTVIRLFLFIEVSFIVVLFMVFLAIGTDINANKFCIEKGFKISSHSRFSSDYLYDYNKDIECMDANRNTQIFKNVSRETICLEIDKWGDCSKTEWKYKIIGDQE